MTSFSDYLAHGNAWLYIPAAILLGALHGLEPGHSKTMMAAFIVAIRGTVLQAVLLGLSVTVSHTALIWILAFIGMHYAGKFSAEDAEPYLQVATGIIVILMAAWMFWRIRKMQRPASHGPHGGKVLKADNQLIEVSVFEDGVPPRFRVHLFDEARSPIAPPPGTTITCDTVRPGGKTETFLFESKGTCFEATKELPEPHKFELKLHVRSKDLQKTFETNFEEHHDHEPSNGEPHEHIHSHDFETEDEHERAHAREWQEKFTTRNVTTGQLVLFGLTGGLIPCPSAFAVLLICLQVKRFALGFALVLAFSVGLAFTLVTVGALAALSVRQATKRFSGLHKLAARLPYASATLMALIGLFIVFEGARSLLR